MEVEIKQKKGIKRIIRKIKSGDKLYDISNKLQQYKNFVVSSIDARENKVSFSNGVEIFSGEATGDVNEETLRRIQIREAIKSHFEKERVLFLKGIKVLTLFFIDKVSKYREYSDLGEEGNGEYAQFFEEEYNECLREEKKEAESKYKEYLENIHPSKTHNGYFSIDKKTKHLVDPKEKGRTKESDDITAYDLILKNKERLLSFEEPTRFIFSHSALREGWDNPNVFIICALKHSDNTISRRQEIGRGLRLSVNQQGERQDEPETVHDTNILTVIANESYKDFVGSLQKEIIDSISDRPRKANEAYFQGKFIGSVKIDEKVAKKIYRYLLKNDYIDDDDYISEKYLKDSKENTRKELPEELREQKEEIFRLIDSVFCDKNLPEVEDERGKKTNFLNDNFSKKEFQALWERINKEPIYKVSFESSELIEKSIKSLNEKLNVSPLLIEITEGKQKEKLEYEDLEEGKSLKETRTQYESGGQSIHSKVKYDLIGEISEGTGLKRATIGKILFKIEREVFSQFKRNPEDFISKSINLINEQKATMVIEHLSYNITDKTYDSKIFTDAQANQTFSKAGEKLKKHVYDYLITDSEIEREFAEKLDISPEVIVYAKLPRGFFIPTPVGNYNPDWAISFEKNTVKHIYFVAETKGSMSSMQFRKIEESKIECAKKFFETLRERIHTNKVKYGVVTDFHKLMEIVS